jgi:diadenosine tetraphosphate (Ap4A) HIT family hydrolase
VSELERKQQDYQRFLEQPETNTLHYGSRAMRGRVALENDLCFFLLHEDGAELPGSGMILPKAPRETVFDLTPDEWQATYTLLQDARRLLEETYAPDGYTVGWNVLPAGGQHVPIAHLHVIPRFNDEPYAARGLRWWLKQPENRRPEVKR